MPIADRTTEFWIAVGGTFTDCFLKQPDGGLRRHKVLSSGVTKGGVGEGSTRQRIFDVTRSTAVDDFWRGYELRLLDDTGAIVASSKVAHFDRTMGALELVPALQVAPTDGQAYELFGGEEAPVLAIRSLLGLQLDEPIPRCVVRLV